jgi:serpin B
MRSPDRCLSLCLTALSVLGACSGSVEAPGTLISSDLQRITAPEVSSEEVSSLAAGNTDFGLSLYRQVARPGENVFFSPWSIRQAFAMVYAGARGDTEAQMQQALRFQLPQERLHAGMNGLDLALQQRGQQAPEGTTPPELRMVNAIWAQEGYAFEPPFLDVLAQQYGAGVRAVDFAREPEPIRGRINQWVAEQTNDRIQDLLPKGSVRSDARLVLSNALYFLGKWEQSFDPQQTQSASFHRGSGGEQTVKMMHRLGATQFMRGEGFVALGLPYSAGAFRMLLVVPESGQFDAIEARLSAGFLDTVRSALKEKDLYLGLPRFRTEMTLDLAESLPALGMVDAFSAQRADLSGIARPAELFIRSAHHKAFLAVDESGTQAAAATGVVIVERSLPPSFEVDRPFFFLIEDVETRSVLFVGRILAP